MRTDTHDKKKRNGIKIVIYSGLCARKLLSTMPESQLSIIKYLPVVSFVAVARGWTNMFFVYHFCVIHISFFFLWAIDTDEICKIGVNYDTSITMMIISGRALR